MRRLNECNFLPNQPNLQYTRAITQKRVSGGGIHLRSLAPKQQSSEETL